MEKIRFAVAGFGHIGKRHAAMIAENPECELVAICDVNPLQKEALAALGNIVFYPSVDQLLNSNAGFDVLSIATPNGFHEEHAVKGLEAGKHILVEKPLALTKEACKSIIEASVKYRKHVFCVMQNRYSPAAIWLKEILQKKILGKIFIVEVSCFWNRDERYYTQGNWHGTRQLDGGTLFTQFSHFIDMVLWLFGDITNISGRFANFNHTGLTAFEDSGLIHFDFINGGTGSFNYSTSCRDKNVESSMTIIAENGSVKVGGQYMEEVEYCDVKDYTLPELPENYGLSKPPAANHYYVFKNIAEVLKSGLPIATNALAAMKVVETIEKIYAMRL